MLFGVPEQGSTQKKEPLCNGKRAWGDTQGKRVHSEPPRISVWRHCRGHLGPSPSLQRLPTTSVSNPRMPPNLPDRCSPIWTLNGGTLTSDLGRLRSFTSSAFHPHAASLPRWQPVSSCHCRVALQAFEDTYHGSHKSPLLFVSSVAPCTTILWCPLNWSQFVWGGCSWVEFRTEPRHAATVYMGSAHAELLVYLLQSPCTPKTYFQLRWKPRTIADFHWTYN